MPKSKKLQMSSKIEARLITPKMVISYTHIDSSTKIMSSWQMICLATKKKIQQDYNDQLISGVEITWLISKLRANSDHIYSYVTQPIFYTNNFCFIFAIDAEVNIFN